MGRRIPVVIVSVPFVVGCAQPKPMAPPEQPTPSAELKRLGRMVGEWSSTADMISPSPEEMAKMMPEGVEPPPAGAMKGKSTVEWTLGGMYLKEAGWHEVPGGERIHYVGYLTWDPDARSYRGWHFTDWGQRSEVRMTMSDGGRVWQYKGESDCPVQGETVGKGTFTFTSDDTVEFVWTERGAMGEMKVKGTSTRMP